MRWLCLNAVEVPWSRREKNQLREIWKREFSSPDEKSTVLVEEIEKIGVEPFQAQKPLPPIARDEIHLICLLAIGKNLMISKYYSILLTTF